MSFFSMRWPWNVNSASMTKFKEWCVRITITNSTSIHKAANRTRQLGEWHWIFDVLHCNVRWLGQHLALSLYCIRKWRRCIFNTVSHSIADNRSATLLHGNAVRSIFQPKWHQSIRYGTSFERYVQHYVHMYISFYVTIDNLFFEHKWLKRTTSPNTITVCVCVWLCVNEWVWMLYGKWCKIYQHQQKRYKLFVLFYLPCSILSTDIWSSWCSNLRESHWNWHQSEPKPNINFPHIMHFFSFPLFLLLLFFFDFNRITLSLQTHRYRRWLWSSYFNGYRCNVLCHNYGDHITLFLQLIQINIAMDEMLNWMGRYLCRIITRHHASQFFICQPKFFSWTILRVSHPLFLFFFTC